MGMLESIVLPIIFIVIGWILEKRIYTSFTKKGIKRNVARVFAYIFILLVLLLLYVMPNPIMSVLFAEEYPWARLIKLILMIGSLAQIGLRILNEVTFRKGSDN